MLSYLMLISYLQVTWIVGSRIEAVICHKTDT